MIARNPFRELSSRLTNGKFGKMGKVLPINHKSKQKKINPLLIWFFFCTFAEKERYEETSDIDIYCPVSHSLGDKLWELSQCGEGD